ncbi:MAG TPA: protein kinase [Gemmatimonadales bacterium]|nr:protein kinase [Gemmatimonadales bacterium]
MTLDRLRENLADRYRIDRELGRGGMATVYLARDLKHHRDVAVKVLRPELAQALGPERFLREIRITAGLNHPHILPLYDSGEAGDHGDPSAPPILYYVMPRIQGESLQQRLTRQRRLPLDEALTIIRDAASALEYAHSQGVIHRDIKPANILLHEGEAMVADFGIALPSPAAAASGTRLTEAGLLVGTPEYMSPEQSAGEAVIDARSDIYSLASVLYEMLAGEPPCTGPNSGAVFARRFSAPAVPIRRLRESVPLHVDQALQRALARDPGERYPTAALFREALTTAPAVAVSEAPSVAVLPFLNLSPDPDNEYFADGITEDVIAQLSKIRGIKVISGNSVMPLKKREIGLREIGGRLGVAHLLDGSVRRAGDRVRIVAQLIDVGSDEHLWAETYDRQLTDIFVIQSDVALHIVDSLKAELSADERNRLRKEPTGNLAAYQLYLQGRYCLNRFTEEGIGKAIEFFEQAIALDPQYALAHTGIALAYGEMARQGSGDTGPADAYRKARAAVARALELDESLGDSHSMLAFIKMLADLDWTGAEAEFKRALELNPNSADAYDLYGQLCLALARNEEALALQYRARDLNPMGQRTDVATTLLRMGRYAEALASVQEALALDPNYPRAHATLGWACLKNGMPEKGIAALERAAALGSGETLWLGQLGQAYATVGRSDDARRVLRQLEERAQRHYVSPTHLAYVHAGLGDVDAAMDCLERGLEERVGSIYGVKGSFLFANLRNAPRFKALLEKMGLGER